MIKVRFMFCSVLFPTFAAIFTFPCLFLSLTDNLSLLLDSYIFSYLNSLLRIPLLIGLQASRTYLHS